MIELVCFNIFLDFRKIRSGRASLLASRIFPGRPKFWGDSCVGLFQLADGLSDPLQVVFESSLRLDWVEDLWSILGGPSPSLLGESAHCRVYLSVGHAGELNQARVFLGSVFDEG